MLTPVERGAERRLREAEDFARMREPSQLQLAEDQMVIQGHFEPTLTPRAQRNVDHDGRPGSQDLSRQADRLVQVVSRDTEFDGDAVLRIKHGAAANISRNALGHLRVIGWSRSPGIAVEASSSFPAWCLLRPRSLGAVSPAADSSQVGVLKSALELEAVAEQAVDADMPEPDQCK